MTARNVDQLRIAIDQGEAGDKIAFPDPAAAPLGTDDEAGGHPPTAEQLRLPSSIRRPSRSHAGKGFPWPYLLIAGAIAVLLVVMAYIGTVVPS